MAKKKTAKKECNCIDQVNKELERIGSNTRTQVNHVINFKTGKTRSTLVIAVEKEDPKKRERLKTLIPTYCPICGKKYN